MSQDSSISMVITYNPPQANTAIKTSLALLAICKLFKNGSGDASSMMSFKMLKPAKT